MAAVGLPLGALPTPPPQRLPRLKLASVSAPVAEPPSFTIAAWQPQELPAVAPPPDTVAVSSAATPSVTAKAVPVARSAGSTPSSVQLAVKALNPRGAGDPDAITCRVPQQLPGSRLRGPEVCQANKVWAQLAASRQILMPDGKSVIATDLTSEACGSERVAGVTARISGTIAGAKTSYRCN